MALLGAEREYDFTKEDFDLIAALIKDRAGIVLMDNKQNMVYGRLSRRLRVLGMHSFREYCDFIVSPRGNDEFLTFLNAMTTNLTRFFRENHHFEHLGKVVLPQLVERARVTGRRRLRIWSSASSSGEEPYSAAMVVRESLRDIDQWDAKILATDIDTNMLAHGREGVYRGDKAASVPEALRHKYMTLVDQQKQVYKVVDPLRRMIAFKSLNLLGAWPMKGKFDVIFCRNVVIYFDKPTQKTLFERMVDYLDDDGYLYVGHSENLMHITKKFRLVGQSTYMKA